MDKQEAIAQAIELLSDKRFAQITGPTAQIVLLTGALADLLVTTHNRAWNDGINSVIDGMIQGRPTRLPLEEDHANRITWMRAHRRFTGPEDLERHNG